MKKLLIVIAFLIPVLATAKPASQIAWTPEQLNQVKHDNLEKGKTLAASCSSCHGQNGEGMKAEMSDGETLPAIPALAGQLATYTFKQLRDYYNASRVDESMSSVIKGMSEQDAADLAAWFASLPLPEQAKDKSRLPKAENLVSNGDGKRIVPPCFTCHGGSGQGAKMDIPALAGQHADYLAKTLSAYKKGERHNDVYSRMRLIAQQLSDAEIKELADYYQQLK